MSISWEEIERGVRDAAGDAVRAVLSYDRDGYTCHYVREDVRESYVADASGEAAVRAIVDDLRLESLAGPHQESLYALGPLHATVRVFDDGTLVAVPVAAGAGVAVTVDEDCSVDVRVVVQRVRRGVPDAVVKS